MIDTHTHLYLDAYSADRDETVRRALEGGVETMILPNVDLGTVEPVCRLAAAYPANMYTAMGLHPTEVTAEWQDTLSTIKSVTAPNLVAVGEIGMDLYWDKTFCAQQQEALAAQLQWARGEQLPVILHCREALPQLLEVLRDYTDVPAVFHCFGGTAADVKAIRALGDYYFGIGGTATFKNSGVRDVLPLIGIDRILLETDAPYLAPVPYRGKRNESSYLKLIAHTVADTLGLSVDDVDARTTRNAKTLFGRMG